MEMTIKVESGSFEQIIKDGLESLPKEELQTILKSVILEAFKCNHDFSGALITKVKGDYYGPERTVLGPLAAEAVKGIDFGPELEKIKQEMLDDLYKNHRKILESAILDLLIDKLNFTVSFSGAIEAKIRQILNELRNQQ